MLEDVVFDFFVYVDLLIGVSNGGNVFLGVLLLYGMVKVVVDINSSSN